MTASFRRDAELARLKREKLPRPVAWRIRPSEVARVAADGQHCETRRCRERAVIVTRRWWRSSEAGCVLLSEHLACERHGTEFAARHHIGIDPAGEVSVQHMAAAETAALDAAGRHCDWPWPSCQLAATWSFTERFTVHGEPRADEDLSCDRHAPAFAERFHISITGEEGAR